jgi:hypothetical protein
VEPVILVSKPFKEAHCIKSMALPSAYPSLISTNTTSDAKFLIAMYSAQLAPTAPAPTIVTFILFLFFFDRANLNYAVDKATLNN